MFTELPLVPARRAVRDGRVYGVVAVGAGGRLADRRLAAVVSWPHGEPAVWRCSDGVLAAGTSVTDALPGLPGLPAVPVRWRRRAGIEVGDRVLVVARFRAVVVYPPVVLDRILGNEPCGGAEVAP